MVEKFKILAFFSIFWVPFCGAMEAVEVLPEEEMIVEKAIARLNIRNSPIYQVPVLNQVDEVPGVSHVNCGAHACRNGIILARGIQNPQAAKACMEELYNVKDMREKFQAGGTWAGEGKPKIEWLDDQEISDLIGELKDNYEMPLSHYGSWTAFLRNLHLSDEEALSAMDANIGLAFNSQGDLETFYDAFHAERDFVGVMAVYLKEYQDDALSKFVSSIYYTLYDWKTFIFLGTPDDRYNNLTLNQTRGHWISLVVIKRQGKVFYITTDSLDNRIRVDNDKIHEFVRLLESNNLYETFKQQYLVEATALAQGLDDRYERSKKLLWATLIITLAYMVVKQKKGSVAVKELPVIESSDILPER